MKHLQPADVVVLVLYGLVVLALGAWAARRQADGETYFLGGRDLPWLLVGVSILATAFSAASLLGGPGEAYEHGMLWLQLQLGDLLAVTVVALFFIPAFRGRELTTAYEYLEERFDHRLRLVASLLFVGQVLFRTGILVYGPALALATLVGVDLRTAIVVVGIVATVYTMLGGITAVIWTDALQLLVVVGGLGFCIARLAGTFPGGLDSLAESAAQAGRWAVVDPEQSWRSVRSLPGAVIGYGLLALSVSGTNQQPVQRYLTCRSVADARRAAWTGWAVGLLVTLLTLTVGVLLYAWYRHFTGALPESVATDAIFPHFIATQLPAGVAGLLIAGIFAAAMSSLDSALNSLATATLHDFVRRYRRRPLPRARELHWARWITVGWGALAIGAALYVAGQGTLLALVVRYMGYFAGPVLGVFLLGLATRGIGSGAALTGVVAAFAVVVGLEVSAARDPSSAGLGIWACAVGCAVTVLVAGFVQAGLRLRRGGPPPVD